MAALETTLPKTERLDAAAMSDAALLAQIRVDQGGPAFAELVCRHGSMVMGVCQRLLRNVHDAEDAFQATFVLLIREAHAIRQPDRLASWLYGVARRTALKLRGQLERRASLEQQIPEPPSPLTPPLEAAWREVQLALDEEIARLDEKLRTPLILCYLEGKTHEEAARLVGRPAGSMSWVLDRALTTLRERLVRRGMTLTGGMSSLLLALPWPNLISEQLVADTLRIVGVLGTTSPVVVLANAVLRDMAAERTGDLSRTIGVALLVLVGAAGVGYATVASGMWSHLDSGTTNSCDDCPSSRGRPAPRE